MAPVYELRCRTVKGRERRSPEPLVDALTYDSRTLMPAPDPTGQVEPTVRTGTPRVGDAIGALAPAYGVEVGDAAFPFVLPSASGPRYELKEPRGQAVLQVFYRASW